MFYPWFIFLTARPWAERGSRFTSGLLFFNRAAMGRARFMVYPWFLFLTARPWAERGSWFTRGFFFSTLVRADPSFHSAKF